MIKYLLFLALVILNSCSSERNVGDALLVDNGIFSANNRYEIIFEKLLSNINNRKSFSIKKIPSGDYIVGVGAKNNIGEIQSCILLLRIQDENESILLDFHDSFSKVTWSIKRGHDEKFGYLKFDDSHKKSPNDSYVYLNIENSYKINIEISPSNCIPDNASIELKIFQSGWK